jgi:phosphoribosylaminoimidazolecarboxamide formyltransferase/IMP cyclohydrolase
VDAATAEAMALPGRFLECIVAPGFSAEAIQILTTKPTWKKNVRLVAVGNSRPAAQSPVELRSIDGGVLAQTKDLANEGTAGWKTASKKMPSPDESRDLELAWKLVAQVKSNAIVLVKDGCLIGVGQGQTSRVESVKLALAKAGEKARGAVLGSDAFFPFRDGVDEALKAGVKAFVQPGGSMRDADSVAACDEADATMIFTGVRHFKH